MPGTDRRLALGGIVGPAAFIGSWAVLGARLPGYDPTQDAISRLAAEGAPDQAWMTAGFVAFGVGVPLFGLVLRDELDGPAWATAIATGLATLGVAAFPLDGWAGDVPHGVAAAIGYLTLAATPLLAAGPLARLGRRPAAIASRVIGGAALVAPRPDHGRRALGVVPAHRADPRRSLADGRGGRGAGRTVRSPVVSDRPTSRYALAALLLVMGVLHFVMPKPFMRIVPPILGHPRFWTYASGVAELLSGGLLLAGRTRHLGGWAAAATIVAVYPANIWMAIDAGKPDNPAAIGAWVRLPFQIPLVVWALRIARTP